MAAIDLTVSPSPHATAYSLNDPTRSTENYCNAIHNILQDMDDSGAWYLTDAIVPGGSISVLRAYLYDVFEEVFSYAETAIADHRDGDPISIAKPISTTLSTPIGYGYPQADAAAFRIWVEGYKTMWLIYYMWKTEEDPLLLKEKLQELLVAWPLQDITVELNEDMGQQFKVYPSWKNADL